ncbi:MAG: RNA polymerase sigma factor [Lachnospiraceae bacterium]|nr:RNA polymerase sigma factor [Lachnospiraceae bacterium]
MGITQMTADNELYIRFRSGDVAAFDELIRRYDDSLQWYMYGILGDYQDAEDMMVEAFAKILQKRPRIEGGSGSFKAYLFKTGRNLALNLRKHAKRHEAFSLEGIEAEVPSEESTERQSDAREKRTILYRCLDRMDPKLREVLYLVYLDGLSYADAAKVLKISAKRVDNLLANGKKRMREELEKEGISDSVI